ncbi:MAG: hypothetical protein LBT57_00585 [Puniceicoccales bacterium]|jgi:RNA polymerase sigma-54 factor|nr:hypothetical protein [Puniceicoccales bacterium]
MLELRSGQIQIQRQVMVPALVHSLHYLQLPWPELELELRQLWESNPCIDLIVSPREEGEMGCRAAPATREGRWEENLAAQESLENHLARQVPELGEEEKKIFSFLISHLDERGYLKGSTEELARASPWTAENLESVREILCSLEPKGIGARDIVDCWLAQMAKERAPLREFLLLNRDDLLAKRYGRILRRMHWDRRQLAHALQGLRSLATAPLRTWQENEAVLRMPDLYFSKDGTGNWNLHLASESYTLRWSEGYKDWLADEEQRSDRRAMAYFRTQRQLAKRWMHALSRRTATLRRIGEFILKEQRPFFEEEDHPLRACSQKDAAGELGLNPATLCRALRDKYAALPWGTLALVDFFPGSWRGSGSDIPIPQIRQKLDEWIAEEDKEDPLSDRVLAKRFREEMGWPIPRRTVEAYRRRWGIASANDRRYGL